MSLFVFLTDPDGCENCDDLSQRKGRCCHTSLGGKDLDAGIYVPPWCPKHHIEEYVELLENLVEDYDQIGFENVCHCGYEPYSDDDDDSRCCWVRRSWWRLVQWFGLWSPGKAVEWKRMTLRSDEHL